MRAIPRLCPSSFPASLDWHRCLQPLFPLFIPLCVLGLVQLFVSHPCLGPFLRVKIYTFSFSFNVCCPFSSAKAFISYPLPPIPGMACRQMLRSLGLDVLSTGPVPVKLSALALQNVVLQTKLQLSRAAGHHEDKEPLIRKAFNRECPEFHQPALLQLAQQQDLCSA